METKVLFVIAWERNTNETRYVDDFNTERGTSILEYAQEFESEELAQQYIDDNCTDEYGNTNCYVTIK